MLPNVDLINFPEPFVTTNFELSAFKILEVSDKMRLFSPIFNLPNEKIRAEESLRLEVKETFCGLLISIWGKLKLFMLTT